MAKTEDNGIWKGRTEASLEGIAKSIDDIFQRLNGLPCAERWGVISSLKTSQKYLWAVLCIVFVGIAGLLVKAFVG